MDEFIASLAQKVGLPESVAKIAAAKILAYLKSQLKDSDFGALLGKIPGASELLAEADSGPSGNAEGGMLGGISKMAGSLLGGEAGESVELLGQLSDAGVPPNKAPDLVSGFMSMVQEKAGDDAVAQIASQIPALKSLLQ